MKLTTIQRQFSSSLGLQLKKLEPCSAGANSLVAKVTADDDQCFFIKSSSPDRQDAGQRLQREFKSMQFLWDQGIRDIPQPLFALDSQLMVYQFIDGQTILPEDIGIAHIEECCKFYQKLHQLTKTPEAKALGNAIESCFSLQAYVDVIERRLTKLQASNNPHCLQFLQDELIPVWHEIRNNIFAVSSHGIALDKTLTDAEKTLSPSDVGLHNMMTEQDSDRIVFFDFEFFGWDDPVKQLSDFLLQPAQPLPEKLYPAFIKTFIATLPYQERLIARFRLVFCLLGLKWCLIMLNPFLPERAKLLGKDQNALLKQQLFNAQEKLNTIRHYHQSQEFLQWL